MDEFRTTKQLRRDALVQDALLFCLAFTIGALLYFAGRGVHALVADSTSDFWSISLSDDLLLSGLIAGELFLIWNNGLRQGIRGHSIGKHRMGLKVVDVGDDAPTGAMERSAARSRHGGSARSVGRRHPDRPADRLASSDPGELALRGSGLSRAPRAPGSAAAADRSRLCRLGHPYQGRTRGGCRRSHRSSRRRALVVLDVAGVAGVLGVALLYIFFFSPFLLQFPRLF